MRARPTAARVRHELAMLNGARIGGRPGASTGRGSQGIGELRGAVSDEQRGRDEEQDEDRDGQLAAALEGEEHGSTPWVCFRWVLVSGANPRDYPVGPSRADRRSTDRSGPRSTTAGLEQTPNSASNTFRTNFELPFVVVRPSPGRRRSTPTRRGRSRTTTCGASRSTAPTFLSSARGSRALRRRSRRRSDATS